MLHKMSVCFLGKTSKISISFYWICQESGNTISVKQNCSRWNSQVFFLFECLENKPWHFMWIFYLVARGLNEMSKIWAKIPRKCHNHKAIAFPGNHNLERWGTSWPQWLSLMCLWLVIRRSQVWTLLGPVTFCFLDWSWNHFYSHSLPSADSRRQLSVTGKRKCLFKTYTWDKYIKFSML